MDSADNLIYAAINWVRTLILTPSERRSASNRSLRLRRGKQKVAGSRGLPKRTQGFFVNKPSVLLSSDGTPGSCEYSKQSGRKIRSELKVSCSSVKEPSVLRWKIPPQPLTPPGAPSSVFFFTSKLALTVCKLFLHSLMKGRIY